MKRDFTAGVYPEAQNPIPPLPLTHCTVSVYVYTVYILFHTEEGVELNQKEGERGNSVL
jgi:hypothetical protein